MSSAEPDSAKEKDLRHKLSIYKQMADLHPTDSEYLQRVVELLLLLDEEQEALVRMRELEKLYKRQGHSESATTLKELRHSIFSRDDDFESTFHPFLSELKPEAFQMLLKDSRRHQLQEGETLIRQGDTDNRLYIVLEGELAVLVLFHNQETPCLVHTLGEGSIVGEMAFLDGSSRSATVVANRESTVLELSQKCVLRCLLRFPEVGKELRRESTLRKHLTAINSNHFLSKLDSGTKYTLAVESEVAPYKPFEVIALTGEQLGWVGIIIQGLVRSVVEDQRGNSHILQPLKPGESIGDLEALNESCAMCDMVAMHTTDILKIPKSVFMETMQKNPTIKNRILEAASSRIADTIMTMTIKIDSD